MKKIICLLLALCMMFALVACGGGDDAAKTDDKASTSNTQKEDNKSDAKDEAKPVRTDINVQVYGDSGTLHPIFSHQILGLHAVRASFYESLWCTGYWTENHEQVEELDVAYQLATGMEYVNETDIKVTLREGVTFANGNPFTADDVLFTLETYYNSSQKGYTENVDFERCEIIDEHTLIIAFKSFNFEQIGRLNSVYMFDKESYNEEELITKPNGTGAYVMDEYVPGSYITAHARDDYWGGAPEIKNITFKVINEESQATNAFETGEVDVLSMTPTADYEYLGSLDNAAQISLTMPTCTMIRFNMSEHSKCYTLDARLAVLYAIDFAAINNVAYGGMGYLPQSIVSAASADFQESFKSDLYAELVKGPNLEKAKEHAEKAGIVGETLTIINDGTSTFASCCEVIQACLGKIGVNMEIVQYDAGSFKEKYASPEGWDMFPSEHSNPTNNAVPLATRIITANKLQWSGEAYDTIKATAKGAVGEYDEATRLEKTDAYLQDLEDACAVINLCDNFKVYTFNKNLQNVEIFRMHDYLIKEWSWAE